MNFVTTKKNRDKKLKKHDTKIEKNDLEKMVSLHDKNILPKDTPKPIMKVIEKEIQRRQKLENDKKKLEEDEKKIKQKITDADNEQKKQAQNKVHIAQENPFKGTSFMDKINEAFSLNNETESKNILDVQEDYKEKLFKILSVKNTANSSAVNGDDTQNKEDFTIDSINQQIREVEKEEDKLKFLLEKRLEKLSQKKSDLENSLTSLLEAKKENKFKELEQKLKHQEDINKELLNQKIQKENKKKEQQRIENEINLMLEKDPKFLELKKQLMYQEKKNRSLIEEDSKDSDDVFQKTASNNGCTSATSNEQLNSFSDDSLERSCGDSGNVSENGSPKDDRFTTSEPMHEESTDEAVYDIENKKVDETTEKNSYALAAKLRLNI